jgi:hypothetical protein
MFHRPSGRAVSGTGQEPGTDGAHFRWPLMILVISNIET